MDMLDQVVKIINQAIKILPTMSKPEQEEFWYLAKIILAMIIITGIIGLLVEVLVNADQYIKILLLKR